MGGDWGIRQPPGSTHHPLGCRALRRGWLSRMGMFMGTEVSLPLKTCDRSSIFLGVLDIRAGTHHSAATWHRACGAPFWRRRRLARSASLSASAGFLKDETSDLIPNREITIFPGSQPVHITICGFRAEFGTHFPHQMVPQNSGIHAVITRSRYLCSFSPM